MNAAVPLAHAGALFALTSTLAVAVADPLKLEPGKPIELQCSTKSVVVAKEAVASSGAIRLKLDVAPAQGAMTGTWAIVSADAAHVGSLALAQRETCAKGCPLLVTGSGEAQLWSPRAMAIQEMKDGESLLIAVIKPDTLALRASTFRSKQIEALEEGQCRMVPE